MGAIISNIPPPYELRGNGSGTEEFGSGIVRSGLRGDFVPDDCVSSGALGRPARVPEAVVKCEIMSITEE